MNRLGELTSAHNLKPYQVGFAGMYCRIGEK
jgi:hypothetical protein